MTTGIVKDLRYLAHDMGAYHVESPQRLVTIYKMIEGEIDFPLALIEPRLATEQEVGYVHHPAYVQFIKQTAGKERVFLDPDTSTSARSFETALLAAGGLLKAADSIMEGKIRNGFALVRPPGHHAEADHAKGFCIFNNVAVAAEYLLRKHGLKRILIADWDLHHGNGTQNAFYSRNDVLYFSTHQFPYYPGSGYWDEIGEGAGQGFTVNVPLSSGKTDEDYLFIYKNILGPMAAAYKPEFILVSAGFDTHAGDPLGGMMVTGEGFGALAAVLLSMAGEQAQGRILFTLEGGYSPEGLADGVHEVLMQLAAKKIPPAIKADVSVAARKEISPVIDIQKDYWPL
jgi:acetoin utilization deacetylase AcuC-like enzyme